ncbi:MAG: hypothetical protein WCS84_08240 [Nocardioides sp.]|jgi:hypothetical protein
MAIGPEKLLQGAKIELVATLILGGKRFPSRTWTIEYEAIAQDPNTGRAELAAAIHESAARVAEEQH